MALRRHINMTPKSEVICKKCDKLFWKKNKEIKKTKNNFCSRSCAISFNNTGRKRGTKTKVLSCKNCGSKQEVNNHTAAILCYSCKKQKSQIRKKTKRYVSEHTFECKICQKMFTSKWKRATCSSKCLHISSVNAGISSARSQSKNRRSKNEKYFAKLCKEKFTNVLENNNFFCDKNGNYWDADLILVKEKIAILWNGIWHYKKVRKKHSLKQVQIRDKIKKSIIINCGFTPYIIKDMGKENPDFVNKKFEEFLTKLESLSNRLWGQLPQEIL